MITLLRDLKDAPFPNLKAAWLCSVATDFLSLHESDSMYAYSQGLTSESHLGASSAFTLGRCLYLADVEAVHHVRQTNNYRQSQYRLQRSGIVHNGFTMKKSMDKK